MRFPWPEHVNTKAGLFFALALLVFQLALGTSPYFAMAIFLFVIETVIAFNLAGGLYTFAGAFIAFQSTQSLIISQVAKCFFLQPADSNLRVPSQTALVYALGGLGMIGAVLVSNKMSRKEPIYDSRKHESTMMPQSIVASSLGIIAQTSVGLFGLSDEGVAHGSFLSYLNQLPNFLPLGVLIGTAHIIRSSGGKRSARWYTIIPLAFQALLGLALNTKQGIFQPILVWFMVGLIYRYRFSRLQIAGVIAYSIFAAVFLFPFIQFSRSDVREGNIINRMQLVYQFARDNSLEKVRETYHAEQRFKELSGHESAQLYYGTDEEALDRFSLIENEDLLIDRVNKTATHGLKPFVDTVLYLTPRFIWPQKGNIIGFTNELGREIGVIAQDDEGTFISFSMYAPAYYMDGWWGVLFLPFLSLTVYFTLVQSFYGNVRQSTYCLLPILLCIHGAPETTPVAPLGALIQLIPASYIIIKSTRVLSPLVSIFLAKSGLNEGLTRRAENATVAEGAFNSAWVAG